MGKDGAPGWFSQLGVSQVWSGDFGQVTSAQVMISQFVVSDPASGSMLTAQSLEPVSNSVSLCLWPPPLTICLTLSLKNKHLKNLKK